MLEIDPVTILAEIVNFIILAAALYFLFFKPITKRMDQQAEEKEKLLTEAKEKDKDAAKLLGEIELRLSNIAVSYTHLRAHET